MNEHIKKLSDTIIETSKNELMLNEKIREIARQKHDYALLKAKNE